MKNGITMLCLLLVPAMLLLTPGCGNRGVKPVPVSGTVTIDGKPLTGGFVRVVSDNSRSSGGTIGADGRFTLGCFNKADGCVTGTHKVEVHGFDDLSETKRKWLAPKRYASTATSGLTAAIDGPTDALEIKLTWAGDRQPGPFLEESPVELRRGRGPASRVQSTSR